MENEKTITITKEDFDKSVYAAVRSFAEEHKKAIESAHEKAGPGHEDPTFDLLLTMNAISDASHFAGLLKKQLFPAEQEEEAEA